MRKYFEYLKDKGITPNTRVNKNLFWRVNNTTAFSLKQHESPVILQKLTSFVRTINACKISPFNTFELNLRLFLKFLIETTIISPMDANFF